MDAQVTPLKIQIFKQLINEVSRANRLIVYYCQLVPFTNSGETGQSSLTGQQHLINNKQTINKGPWGSEVRDLEGFKIAEIIPSMQGPTQTTSHE